MGRTEVEDRRLPPSDVRSEGPASIDGDGGGSSGSWSDGVGAGEPGMVSREGATARGAPRRT